MAKLTEVFVRRREGLIVFFASLVYLVLGLLAKLAPAVAPVGGFYGMLSLYLPFALMLAYWQMGGFKTAFESGAFNTFIVAAIALLPLALKVKSLLWN